MSKFESDNPKLDEAARAGWLYYVGGRTQDEIAKTMGISRQSAQRLVSRAVTDGLIRVKIEHPIADLMSLGQELRGKFGLKRVRVAPDIGVEGNLSSVAPYAGRMIEEVLWRPEPQTIGLGTGRALRSAVEQVSPLDATHHRLVSFISIIAPDGTANFYDAIMRLADLTRAPHYPLPIPALAETQAECAAYQKLTVYKNVQAVANEAQYVFVGIGQMDSSAPIIVDGFMNQKEWEEAQKAGAIGEIAGRAYNAQGEYLETDFFDRVTSIAVRANAEKMVVAVASGSKKLPAIRGALKGGLINALVTDEPTARALLAD